MNGKTIFGNQTTRGSRLYNIVFLLLSKHGCLQRLTCYSKESLSAMFGTSKFSTVFHPAVCCLPAVALPQLHQLGTTSVTKEVCCWLKIHRHTQHAVFYFKNFRSVASSNNLSH